MKLFLICLLAFSTASLHAQEDTKNRILFQPGSNQPVESPSPSPTPVPPMERKDLKRPSPSGPKKEYKSTKTDPLDATVDVFFLALQDGNVEIAYDNLVHNSPVADEPAQVEDLKTKTIAALDTYGPIVGYELIDERHAGNNLVRRTYFSHGDTQPLRWRFYFYRIKEQWRLVDFRVDDGLLELFETDSMPRR